MGAQLRRFSGSLCGSCRGSAPYRIGGRSFCSDRISGGGGYRSCGAHLGGARAFQLEEPRHGSGRRPRSSCCPVSCGVALGTVTAVAIGPSRSAAPVWCVWCPWCSWCSWSCRCAWIAEIPVFGEHAQSPQGFPTCKRFGRRRHHFSLPPVASLSQG